MDFISLLQQTTTNSSLKVSLRVKTMLDNINKNNLSYDRLLFMLAKQYKQLVNEETSTLSITTSTFKRKRNLVRWNKFVVSYSYNEFVDVEEFEFCLKIDKVILNGCKSTEKELYEQVSKVEVYYTLLCLVVKEQLNIKLKSSIKYKDEVSYWKYVLSKVKLPYNIYKIDVEEVNLR